MIISELVNSELAVEKWVSYELNFDIEAAGTEEQKIINQFNLDLYKDDMMEQPEDESKKDKHDEVGKRIRRNFFKIRKRIWKSIKVTCLQSS